MAPRRAQAAACGLAAVVLLLVLSLSFAPSARAAETGGIAGTVDGRASQEPVDGIEVTVYGASGEQAGSATTDASGEYVVSGLPFGKYKVGFSRGLSTLDYATWFWPSGYSSSEGQWVEVVSPGPNYMGIMFLPLAEAPTSSLAPTISGVPQVGQTLTCSVGLFGGVPPPAFSYQWLRNGTAIAGATASGYTVQSADQEDSLACEVTATNSAGQKTATSAGVSIPPAIPPGGGSTGGSGTVSGGAGGSSRAPSGVPFFREPPPLRYPPEPRRYPSRRARRIPPADVGLYVAFCPARGHLARARAGSVRGSARAGSASARAAGTSEKGWPPDQCLKMDKGSAGRRHTLVGVLGVHNWLLGGYGNDTIVGGNVGDVIWADYHPEGEPRWQSAIIRAGNGRNVIYANDRVNYVWTGTNPRTVVHAHDSGTSGVIHCQSSGIVVFLSNTSERHFKLDGCYHISHYSVGY